LAGCVPLIVGGGAVTTALVASDRRTSGMYLEDERIEQKASAQLRDLLNSTQSRANVTSFNRVALITGEVRTPAEKERIEQIVSKVENVRAVVNELEVVPFVSSITQRAQDTFITSKVKASLIDAKDLQANSIKVVTELNVVYLMGIVTQSEGKRAAEIARGVNDVRKVVRVFEYISDAELAGSQTRTDKTPTLESTEPAP